MKQRYNILLNVLLPIAIAIILLYLYKADIRPSSDIGLGKGTSSYTPLVDNYPIHIRYPNLADSMRKGWVRRLKRKVNLWVGNSQLHGINQYVPGNNNCIGFLFNRLDSLNEEVLGVSFPNGNLQEFLVSTIYFTSIIPAKRIFLPVFYDDMREDGIRDIFKIKPIIDSVKQEAALCSGLSNIVSFIKPENEKQAEAPGDFKGLNETIQNFSERYLNNVFEKRWSIWKARADIRGNIYNDVYNTRNSVLGINASSIRKMIPGRYTANYNALLEIIKYCSKKNIQLIIYIPPIRNDVRIPYDISAYNQFKKNIQQLCNQSAIRFINLEALVPNRFWGTSGVSLLKNNEGNIDFMHFKEQGHKLIADTIFNTIMSLER